MTSKVELDRLAISQQIQTALAGVAIALSQTADQAIASIGIAPNTLDKSIQPMANGYEIAWESTTDVSADQLHEGAVLKDGTRLSAHRWTQTALEATDLAQEFKQRF
jgi:hypothetical protein